MIRKVLKYILIFFITLGVMLGLLVIVAKIPQDNLKENVRESAEYYCDTGMFTRLLDGVNGSAVDHYADSILVNIAYHYEAENPLQSLMWSSYYFDEHQNENKNLLQAVNEDREANQQYLRYWHGSNVFVRPLLACFNVKEIYVINAVIIALLILGLLAMLILRKAYVPAVAFAIGLIAVGVWFVPTTFEYTWNFVVMLVMSIIGIAMAYKDSWGKAGALFLVGGMVTNYLDFLSTETITLTVPLLFMLWIRDNNSVDKNRKETIVFAGKSAIVWGIGYVGMWISKWVVSAIVLGQNTLPYISSHVKERLDGDVGLSLPQYVWAALVRNTRCLFPFEYGVGGIFLGVGLIIFALYIGYVHYGKKEDKKYIMVYVLIALVPYIRYVVLHNHAYLHYFFTYRAQLATVMSVVFVLELLTDRRLIAHGKAKRRKA
ncbi:MAG: hypothetical protein IKJ73_01490 [Lachnospiraceae bacterium]|nr:hypothetical protein [Lachnospiraceae bacterium]